MKLCSCGAPIEWAETPTGASMPYEPEPAADGDLELEQVYRGGDEPVTVAHVVGGAPAVHAEQLGLELAVEQRELERYRSHWARCPDAPTWRREL